MRAAPSIDGIDVGRDPREVKRRIGIQLQASAFFDELTLVELLDLFGRLYERDGRRRWRCLPTWS